MLPLIIQIKRGSRSRNLFEHLAMISSLRRTSWYFHRAFAIIDLLYYIIYITLRVTSRVNTTVRRSVDVSTTFH